MKSIIDLNKEIVFATSNTDYVASILNKFMDIGLVKRKGKVVGCVFNIKQ